VLSVHRAPSTAELAEQLAQLLGVPPADPLQVDLVAVPSRGVERWLAQRLSHRLGAAVRTGAVSEDGVCANVLFPAPRRLFAAVQAAAAGRPVGDAPWDPERTCWVLLALLERHAGEPWCAPLSGYLAGDGRSVSPGRRLATARKLARLFASYAAARPGMLRSWTSGSPDDGAGGAVPADLGWQVELWRRLRAAVDAPDPVDLLASAARLLRERPEAVDLPARLSLFGPTRLSTAELDLLSTLALGRDVHVWLPHPSPALWRTVAGSRPAGPRRGDDPSGELIRVPLLASLGRDLRELQLRLAAAVPDAHDAGPVDEPPVGSPGAAGTPPGGPLLGRLQHCLAADRPPERPLPLAAGDRSVQVHACHGPARQIEVLRDLLVGLFADDPSLEPRDVLVMCPNVEDYAPLAAAAFGFADDDDAHPGHRVRVRLADRAPGQTNPLLGLLVDLVALASARVTASEVLDLAAAPPVRQRFRFGDDDLERLRQWVEESGVRWGLDAEHRAAYRLDRVPQNTWHAGLDRILLGVAMADDGRRWVGRALPLDDVGSTDIDLAGRLAELLARLRWLLDRMAGRRPLEHWLAVLADALTLFAAPAPGQDWQLADALRELAAIRSDAGGGGAGPAAGGSPGVVRGSPEHRVEALDLGLPAGGQLCLDLGDVRVLLAERLRGRPTRANFRTGNLTISSMVPMRSVPHRVICLLGLDDGRFPRNPGLDGDDLLGRSPCIGERDPASEDRQLLLDAMFAAREQLVVLYTGADPRTNAERPPAVPVGELLDTLDALAVTADGRRARDQVVVRHPLQPFDPRNFEAGALGPPRPFSFDRVALDGARRAGRPRAAVPGFLDRPLDAPPGTTDVELDALIAFAEHPCRNFVRQRLGISLPGEQEDRADAIPIELDGLHRWAVGHRLLAARLAGADVETCRAAEWRRGEVPPGRLGSRLLDGLGDEVEPLVAAAEPFRSGTGRAVDLVVDLGGRRLSGTVGGVHGHTVLRVEFSRLAAKQRLRAWLQLLALSAARPGEPWQAVTIGRPPERNRRGAWLSRLAADADADGAGPSLDATARLLDWLALYDRGQREPLPLATRTSAKYAEGRVEGMPEATAAARAAETWTVPGRERDDPAHRLVWGADAAFAELCRAAADDGAGGTLFAQLARRVWEPLLAAERVGPA
jgi:exodeoxyribonuclease V gamma subunit